MLGLVAPGLYTIKAYVIRVAVGAYRSWDLGVDAILIEHICYTIMCIASIQIYGLDSSDLFWGSVAGLLHACGKQSICIAYDEGPGGVVNTVLCTMSIYQILMAYFIDH